MITGALRRLHAGEPGETTIVAERAPHYPYWSPDGNRLAFIGGSSEGLKLYLDDLRDDTEPTFALGKGPLWMAWSPDSSRLLVHRGADHLMVDAETANATTLPLPTEGLGYRVPSWSPSGEEITFIAGDGSNGLFLYLSTPDALDFSPVKEVPPTRRSCGRRTPGGWP